MSMHRSYLMVCLATFFTILVGPGLSAQSREHLMWEKLGRPPVDTSDAQDVRIWFQLKHEAVCRVEVSIFDTASHRYRSLVQKPLGRGYYNLYWDKRDDSGRWAPPGRYVYLVNTACDDPITGGLKVKYKKWERAVRLVPDSASDSASATLEIDSSHVPVTLRVMTPDGVVMDTLCSDSLFSRGRHRVVWRPKTEVALGEYYLRLNAKDYVTQEKIKLK